MCKHKTGVGVYHWCVHVCTTAAIQNSYTGDGSWVRVDDVAGIGGGDSGGVDHVGTAIVREEEEEEEEEDQLCVS